MTNEDLLNVVHAHMVLNYSHGHAVYDDFEDTRHIWNDGGWVSGQARNEDMTDYKAGELVVWSNPDDMDTRFAVQYTLNPELLEHCNEESRSGPRSPAR